MTERSTLDGLVDQLSTLLAPLSGLTPARAPDLLTELGLPLTPAQANAIGPALATTSGATGALLDLTRELQQAVEAEQWVRVLELVYRAGSQVVTVITGLDELRGALAGLNLPDAGPILAEFPRRVLDLLLARLVDGTQGVPELLEFLGVLVRTDHNVTSTDPQRPFYTEHTFDLGRLSGWLTAPDTQLGELYGWGAPTFDGTTLLSIVDQIAAGAGLPSRYDPTETPPVVDVVFATLTPRTDLSPRGVAIALPAGLSAGAVQRAGQRWSLILGLSGDVPAGTSILLQPGRVSLQPLESTSVSATASVAYQYRRDPGDPLALVAIPGGSQISVEQVDASAAFRALPGGAVDVEIGAQLRQGQVLITFDGADGFLATVLGGLRMASAFEVGATFAPSTGLRFTGSGALEVRLGAHADLGPVEISGVSLLVGIRDREVALGLAADLTVSLGPITGVVQAVGTDLSLALPADRRGNLGPVDVRPRFRAPAGIGLSLDLDVVSGGGFLAYDPQREEYAGALELELAGFLEVKAIGLITTRMPDGAKGFSLLIMMTAEFGAGGIQLGYGFTLLAVGGLIGLNRTMRLDALVDGVRSGAIESVMFPRDVVANAPRILSDLRAFFPPEEGKFLIGPMLKIGWGTPALLTISVGVIIEIPGNIAIVGVLRVALPSRDAPLMLLQVNFIGAVEFDKERFFFFASLFESRVLFMTIDGEMGVLAAWGADANLVVSVGGFHPAYRPPPLPFPSPRRVSVDILNLPGRLIRVSGYFAITSNTVQFGAKAELRLGFSDFGIEGHLAFDALFQFSPFRFLIQISAAVSLKAFGVGLFSIRLSLALEGPAPWRARGRGSISLLFFEISADFDITWGEERDTTLPPVDVIPLLGAEIAKLEGWRTVGPADGRTLVTLRKLPETDDLVLHPMGTLFIQQRAVPLDLRLDRIGGQRPRDARRLSVSVTSPGLAKRADVDDRFAMAQFQDMDDAAKLSLPAFEPQHAGLEVGPDSGTLAASRVVRRSSRYEENIIDTERTTHGYQNLSPALFTHLLDGNSVSRSPLSAANAALVRPAGEAIQVTGDDFVIARTQDNTVVSGAGLARAAAAPAPAVFRSNAAAREHLAGLLAAEPHLAGALHVIPAAEAEDLR